MPNLVKSTPRWRRHVIPVILLLALASLLVGAARPQRPVLADKRAATIVLAMDTSRSMSATDIKPNRLDGGQGGRAHARDGAAHRGRVGVVAFTRSVHVLNTPTDDRSVISGSLDALKIGGGTAIGDAIAQSQKLVHRPPHRGPTVEHGRPPRRSCCSRTARAPRARSARRGRNRREEGRDARSTPSRSAPPGHDQGSRTGGTTSVAPDPKALAAIAKAGGGQSYTARNAVQLKSIYKHIGKKIGTEQKQQDLGVGFIGLATLLLLGSTGSRCAGSAARSERWRRAAVGPVMRRIRVASPNSSLSS